MYMISFNDINGPCEIIAATYEQLIQTLKACEEPYPKIYKFHSFHSDERTEINPYIVFYLEDKQHIKHYKRLPGYNGLFLVFSKIFMENYLINHNFKVKIWDTEENKTYKKIIPSVFESDLQEKVFTINNCFSKERLYKKLNHLIDEIDHEYVEDRFIIHSISYQGLILYSETTTLEDLEELLCI